MTALFLPSRVLMSKETYCFSVSFYALQFIFNCAKQLYIYTEGPIIGGEEELMATHLQVTGQLRHAFKWFCIVTLWNIKGVAKVISRFLF